MPRSVAVSSICSKGCRRARGRPGRCAPLRGALRASLTAAARGGFRKRRSGRRDGPLIEQQDGCLDPTLSESLDTSTTARFNGETPLSARMSSLLCAPGDISILRRHPGPFGHCGADRPRARGSNSEFGASAVRRRPKMSAVRCRPRKPCRVWTDRRNDRTHRARGWRRPDHHGHPWSRAPAWPTFGVGRDPGCASHARSRHAREARRVEEQPRLDCRH
jgi:hypothetical protein